jgi:hypothetical protein
MITHEARFRNPDRSELFTVYEPSERSNWPDDYFPLSSLPSRVDNLWPPQYVESEDGYCVPVVRRKGGYIRFATESCIYYLKAKLISGEQKPHYGYQKYERAEYKRTKKKLTNAERLFAETWALTFDARYAFEQAWPNLEPKPQTVAKRYSRPLIQEHMRKTLGEFLIMGKDSHRFVLAKSEKLIKQIDRVMEVALKKIESSEPDDFEQAMKLFDQAAKMQEKMVKLNAVIAGVANGQPPEDIPFDELELPKPKKNRLPEFTYDVPDSNGKEKEEVKK